MNYILTIKQLRKLLENKEMMNLSKKDKQKFIRSINMIDSSNFELFVNKNDIYYEIIYKKFNKRIKL